MPVITAKNGGETITAGVGNDTIYGGTGNDSLDGASGDDNVYGNAGNDTLIGGDGNDYVSKYSYLGGSTLYGGAGADTVLGGLGNDSIDGGDGNDSWLQGYAGNDYISGGSGDDELYGDEGNDILDGGVGSDYLAGGDGNDFLLGGEGNDSLNGGSGQDLILAGAGDDVINKLADTGNDTVFAGDGNDFVNYFEVEGNKLIYGDSGNDSLNGGNGIDSIDGGIGNDSIDGNSGNDSLFGGEGNDTLYGGDGNDSEVGGLGNDYLSGGGGNDTLDGGVGNDKLYGGTGNDSYSGGDGNDYISDDGGNNFIDGGTGNDTVYGDSGNDTIIGSDGDDSIIGLGGNNSLDGGLGNDYLSGFGGGNNTLNGGVGNDSLYGGDGNDSEVGGLGNDYLSGGGGNDTLDGGVGNDELYGGTGNDTYHIRSISQSIFDSGGIDTANVYANFVKLPSSIENVFYLDGAIELPYWISALLPDESAGLRFTNLLQSNSVINYAFPEIIPVHHSSDAEDKLNWAAFTTTQQARAEFALSYVSTVIGVRFFRSSDSSALNTITFANNNQTGSSANAYFPSDTASGSDVFLDNTENRGNSTISDGTFAAYTLIHELGHAIGLKHPFQKSEPSGNIANPPYLSVTEDKTTWTIMSYEDSSSEYYLKFSPLDIAALQYLYGPSKTARTGNDTYRISLTEPNFVWDGDGIDVIDAGSVTQAASIYLAPGYQGFLGTTKAEKITTAGQITVNFGSVIENLIGSNYDDSLYGNDVGNKIEGGTGSDSIEGWGGDDTLLGGGGNDYLTGGPGNDSVEGGDGNDTLVVNGIVTNYTIRFDSITQSYSIEARSGTEGKDTFKTIEFLKFSDKTLAIQSVDLTPPTIAITSDLNSLGIGKTATITFTLSEASTSFTASDVTVSGGTLTNFIGSGSAYAATFTPTANSTTNGLVSVASGVFTDSAGNLNVDGSDSNNAVTMTVNTVPVDKTPPTIAITSDLNSLGIGKTATITFTLSEASTTFTVGEITFTGGTLSNFKGGGTSFTATFIPTENSITNGVIGVPSGVFSDLAGNLNADGSDSNNTVAITVDTVAPLIALSTNKTNLIAGESATLNFTLSEPSTTFTVSSVKVAGGLLSNFKGSDKSYTATFTPTANSVTPGVISLPNEGFTDLSGNTNADGSDTNNNITLAIDTVVPNITLSASKSSLIAGETATVTFTLSESSTNFAASDLIVSGGTLSNFTGNGATYTALFTPKGNITTIGLISVASGVFTDLAGNSNSDGSDTNNKVTFSIDTILPTYSIISDQQSVDEGNTASFKVTTTKIAVGTQINYSIGGVSSQDVSGNLLQSSVLVGANGVSQIFVKLLADSQTEGPETLTVTIEGVSASTLINDTSIYKGPAASDLVYVFKSEKVGLGINPASYSYFYTTNPQEAASIKAQSNWPWVEKMSTFEAAHSVSSLAVPVFRFWSEKFQSHFFTINKDEKDQVIAWSKTGTNGYDWKYEGENFKVYTSSAPTDSLDKSAIPVYRIWMDDKDFNPSNGLSGGHYFTANKTEYETMIKLTGVVGEGVAFYGEVPGN